jgi:hypothetical protein
VNVCGAFHLAKWEPTVGDTRLLSRVVLQLEARHDIPQLIRPPRPEADGHPGNVKDAEGFT